MTSTEELYVGAWRVAGQFGVNTSTVARWALEGCPYQKRGPVIGYRISEVSAWIAARARSAEGAATPVAQGRALTRTQAAAELCVTESTIDRWIAQGRFAVEQAANGRIKLYLPGCARSGVETSLLRVRDALSALLDEVGVDYKCNSADMRSCAAYEGVLALIRELEMRP